MSRSGRQYSISDGVLLSRRGARSKSVSRARDRGRQTLGPCVISFVSGTGLRFGGGGALVKSGAVGVEESVLHWG